MTDYTHLRPIPPKNTKSDILDCWRILDEIHLLNAAVQDKEIDRDSIANILLGLEYSYELRFQKLMETYNEEHKAKTNA